MGDAPRIAVEWLDPERDNWGGFMVTGYPDFDQDLQDMVVRFGPPTMVEFRAANEGCEINGVDHPRTKLSCGEGPLYWRTQKPQVERIQPVKINNFRLRIAKGKNKQLLCTDVEIWVHDTPREGLDTVTIRVASPLGTSNQEVINKAMDWYRLDGQFSTNGIEFAIKETRIRSALGQITVQ